MTSGKRDIIGNFEVLEDEVVTRREVLLMGALAAGSLVAALPANARTGAGKRGRHPSGRPLRS